MNFLSHFVFNHEVCHLPAEPAFAMGVTLPDLWSQFSRRRRIRWRAVRTARPDHPDAVGLRAGLLNHVATDKRFHALRCFNEWQAHLKTGLPDEPSLGREFLTHLAVELALDQHLVRRDPALPQRYYDLLDRCPPARVESHVTAVAAVDATGLADTIRGFLERRFLCRFPQPEALLHVVQFVFGLTPLRQTLHPHNTRAVLNRAAEIVDPETVWQEMKHEPLPTEFVAATL